MENQVDVTLTLKALNGDLSIAERVLTLNSQNNAIPVGRASKSVAKGMRGAANNAWFDSPVMSRDHAIIELNSDDKTVTIQDIGSMHGTYLNDNELPKKTPTVITGNDVLVFGAEVRRGAEVFPACSFQVTCKSTSYKSHRTSASTYTCPESDIEEDGEDNHDAFSEDDLDLENSEILYSSEDDISSDAPLGFGTVEKSRASEAIDLTGDDYPHDSMANHVDLTRQTTTESAMKEIITGPPADIDEHANRTSIAMHAGSHPIVLDSEDELFNEDPDFSSDLDDQEEETASRHSDRASIHAIFEDDSEMDDSQIEDSIIDSDSDSDAEMGMEAPTATNPGTASSLARYAVAPDENYVFHIPDVRSQLELPDSDEADDDSDCGLSETGAEGVNAVYAPSSSLPAPDWEDENETENAKAYDPILETIYKSAFNLASSLSTNAAEASPEVKQGSLRPFSLVRQPSPSDAAMVKSAIIPRQVSICGLGATDDYSPQALGEKSGKPAFFAAREVNKAKFDSVESDRTLSPYQSADKMENLCSMPSKSRQDFAVAMSSAAAGNFSRGWTDASQARFDPFDAESSKPLVMSSGAAGKFFAGNMSNTSLRKPASSIPTRDFCSFLDKPDEFLIPARSPSPLPDMTSSFSYNNSKDAMKSVSAPQPSPRTAIKIPDLVESSSLSNDTKSGLKRKLESISNVTQKELREWANSNVSSDTSGISLSVPIQRMSSCTEAPAAKRFKKLLANAGYVALGGAALFATLVATAPELM